MAVMAVEASGPGKDLLVWQSTLRPGAVKLLNGVCAGTMEATVQRFSELGFPWAASEAMDAFAELVVSASVVHGFYAECYAQLVFLLSSQPDESCSDFMSSVKRHLAVKLQAILQAMSKTNNEPVHDQPQFFLHDLNIPGNKLRDRLVNSCKLAASLFHFGVYSVVDMRRVLQCLGVLNVISFKEVAAADAAETSTATMPRVAMLSGNCPSTQPACGETMAAWRDRLSCELNVPAHRLALLAGELEVPPDSCLDDFQGALQVFVRRVDMKEEYRIEAACTLLTNATPDLVASKHGVKLLEEVMAILEQLAPGVPKRAQFMIMDLIMTMAKHGLQ